MAWRSASSDEPVTVAFLLARQVSLDWHAAVSIVLEVAEVFERSGQGAMPEYRHLAITPAGSVEFLRGRTEKGHPVKALAQMLNTLLPRDRPTQLRLIVSTAGPEGSSYTSVAEFSEALKYFERPGRQDLIADVYARARATPPPAEPKESKKEAETDRPKRPLRLGFRRFAVPVAAVLVSGLVVAAGIAYLEHRDPGSVSTSAGSVQDAASGAWDAALGVGGSFRDSASRDLAAVFDRMRGLGSDDTADPSDEADVNAPVAKTETRVSRPASGGDASANIGGGQWHRRVRRPVVDEPRRGGRRARVDRARCRTPDRSCLRWQRCERDPAGDASAQAAEPRGGWSGSGWCRRDDRVSVRGSGKSEAGVAAAERA